jgi:hypothetical protein
VGGDLGSGNLFALFVELVYRSHGFFRSMMAKIVGALFEASLVRARFAQACKVL